MRTSTNQGKIPAGICASLLPAITLALACLVFAFAFFRKPDSSQPQTSSDKPPASIFKPQATNSRSQISNPESQIPNSVFAKNESLRRRGQKGKELREEQQVREREQVEEMERELKEARERYDKPDEAARYLLNRRLPEGETELRFELYQRAMERARDLPQYSTLQRRLLPSLREMGREMKTNAPDALQAWTPLGPGNIGGRTRALLIHPRNPETMFAAAASGGVWRTTDGGKSWTPLTDLMANLAVNALAFDPNNPDTIYAGTGEGFFSADSTRGAGIFRSFDGGNTWRRLDGTGLKNFWYVNDIVVSKNNYNRIYAATRSGVMRSVDGGANWTPVLNEEANGGCSDLAMRTDTATDVVFAACGLPSNIHAPGNVTASIYRNDNAAGLGRWDVVHTEDGMSRTSLAIAPSNQNVIYAVSSENGATGAPHSLHGVFRSAGGGDPHTWVKVNDGKSSKLNGVLFTNPIWAFQNECRPGVGVSQYFHQGWFDNVIAVDPQNESIVWVGGIDLFRSDDGGANWGMASFWHEEKTNARYVHADQHAIAFHPQFNGGTNRTMFAGTDGGIFRTDNARAQTVTGNRAPCSPELSRISWLPLNNGYGATQFYHGLPFPDGRTYFGGTQDNGTVLGSDDYGPNGWRELLGGDGGYVAVDPTNTRILYAENNGLSLKKSINGGLTWFQATTGISNVGFGFIVPFVMDPSDPERLWTGGGHLYRTRNGAGLWTRASTALTGSATAIAVAPSDSSFVLAGTDQGHIYRSISPNPGADTDWPNAKPRSGTVSSVAFDPSNRDIAYATYSNFGGGKHVWRTVNGGASWTAIDGLPPTGPAATSAALPDIPVNCIIVDPTNTQRLYIGTDIGVFTSPDGGATWAVENTGFTNAPVEWLAAGAYNGAAHLFAFSRGRGAWRVPLGQVCTYSLAPVSQTFNAAGGRGNLMVTASGNECAWRVENNPNWIAITTDVSMRGSGAVGFDVAPEPNANPRSATFTVAGASVTVMQAGVATSVSAASFLPNLLAPESIVTAYGAGLANSTESANGSNLPFTLLGVSIKVRDSAGAELPARLFFVSPYQVNYEMPGGLADGSATVTVFNGNDKLFNSPVRIRRVAPGLFAANATGKGVVMGQALHYRAGNLIQSELLAMWDANQSHFAARPIDLGTEGNEVFLAIYGTGLRLRSSLQKVIAKIGGVEAEVKFVGAQGDFAGLDQVNILLPRSLAGRGDVDLVLTVDGQQANIVRVSIK
jgi:uncharacterized protein (TIGR03437 family)